MGRVKKTSVGIVPTASRPGSGSLRPLLEAASGPVHTGTWPASHGALLIGLPFRSCYYACVAGIEGWSTKKRLWRGGTLSKASSHIHTGRGDSGPFVCRDPPTLLLFTTLSSKSQARRPKSLRPADRIRIRPIWGCWGGSRKPRWESCRRPPGLVPAPFGLSWRRLRVLFTPGRGLRATAHC